MRMPALAQGLEASPAIVWMHGHAEQLAQFSVKIVESRRGACDRTNGEVADASQAFGKQAECHALAGAGIAADESEAALAHQAIFNTPAEALDLGADE